MDERSAIELRRLAGHEGFITIHRPMTMVNGQRFHFSDTKIESLGIKIRLAKEIVDMPPNLRERKYPVQSRPSVIKTTIDAAVNFCMEWLQDSVERRFMAQYRDEILEMIKKTQGQFTFHDTGLTYQKEDGQGALMAWFDYTAPTFNVPMYARHWFMHLADGKVLYMVFNCPAGHKEAWLPVAQEIVRTIEIDE